MVTGHGSLTSAAGVLALLEEPENELKVFALSRLDELVDTFWAEIADNVSKIEELHEDVSFPDRKLSALVVSKVYYHLGSFQDSLMYALSAGDRFNVNTASEYTETILSKCIDHYTALRVKKFEKGLDEGEVIDPRLEAVVERMFEKCIQQGHFKQAAGIAFETRRIDVLEQAILQSIKSSKMSKGGGEDILPYCLKVALSLLNSRRFRNNVLRVLVSIYSNLEITDYISICQCYIFLDDPQSTAQILEKLARSSSQMDALMAYQIGFDLYESAPQNFLLQIQDSLMAIVPKSPSPPFIEVNAQKKSEEEASNDKETAMETEKTEKAAAEKQDDSKQEKAEPKLADVVMEEPDEDTRADMIMMEKGEARLLHSEEDWVMRLKTVNLILGGARSVSLHQEFLIRSNHANLQLLKIIKDSGRNSITHNATVIANGLMHFGTTSDVFLREHLDWLKRASNWAKFTATASLGVIHYGHEKEALNLMSSYLPKDSSGSPYAEGGGLYALGLIHANHGRLIMDYLSQELQRANQNEVVRHGGCLGLGLAAMGTADTDTYNLLKENLFQDDAVIGEAAGIAMGLVMLGRPTVVKEMIDYAQETQHEKIQRGLALGIAMLFYGQLEEADTAIEELCHHKDPLLRRAGMFTIAMAYCGSGENRAIKRLLHIAVSDVDNDVRRSAVTSIGFVMFRSPDQCPTVVALLAESFNPHVRCGAAWALGIACAASGNKEALSIIEPMLSDAVPFVQQSALVASAMILIQQTEGMCSRVGPMRQRYLKILGDKLEDSIARMGAILALGIVNAGGCNVTISLQSRTGHTNMCTVVGLLVATQFWYWFPLCHFFSLSFTPTSLIALNCNLKMPRMKFRSNAKPSLYSYPPVLEKEKGREREKVATAVLSVTAKKTKAKLKKQSSNLLHSASSSTVTGGKEESSEAMEVDTDDKTSGGSKEGGGEEVDSGAVATASASTSETSGVRQSEVSTKDGEGDKKATSSVVAEKKSESEPSFELLSNPARVLPQQLKVISMMSGCRYVPVKPVTAGGIILLDDTGSDAEDLIEPLNVALPGQEDEEEDEPLPPEPFEYTED